MLENYFLYVAGISCTFAIFSYLYKVYKVHKVKVNCWFCNKNTRVDYKFSNSFSCPFCEQYNGFKDDGDYNCVIPAQHSEQNSFKIRRNYYNSSLQDSSKFENGFCETCNLNQALKIRAISEFSAVPYGDNDELEKFKARLEEIYSLCQHCHAVLHQTLGKQNSWLKPQFISWRLMQSKEKVLKITSRRRYRPRFCQFFQALSLLACVVICFLSLKEYYPEELQPFKSQFEQSVLTVEETYLCFLYFGIVLQAAVCVLQESVFKIKNIVSFFGWSLLLFNEKYESPVDSISPEELQVILSFSNLLFLYWISRLMAPSQSLTDKDDNRKLNDHSPSLSTSFVDKESPDLQRSCGSPSEQLTPKKKAVHDLDTDLLSLKISTPKKGVKDSFHPQNLFKDIPTSKSPKLSYSNLIHPSKFGKQFITQSSWVAGGYWGSPGSPQRGRLTSQNVSDFNRVKPKPVFSLSRSSSQSSGFVSQFSDCASSKSQFHNLPKQSHSQQSSLTGDPIEKGSVFSWGPLPHNSASSFSSLRHHSLDNFDAQSACSATSFYSDNSQLHLRPSTQSGSLFHDAKDQPIAFTNNMPKDRVDMLTSYNKNTVVPSYFNIGLAFILGISVSANIFLALILSQYDIFSK